MPLATRPSADVSAVFEKAIAALNEPDSFLPLDEVDSALSRAPGDFRLWQVKGLIHRRQEQRGLAIPALRRAAELAPDDALVVHGYARTLFEAGLPSVEQYACALKLAPANPDIVKGLAAALVAEGRVADAIAGIETVIWRSPLWTDGHRLLADLRWANGERRGFTRSFDAAIRAHPNSLELRREQLDALLHGERLNDALERIRDGTKRFGRHPLFIAFEAAVCSERGDVEEADRLFRELAPFADANSDIRHVRHLLRSGQAELSIPIIDKWLDSPERHLFWPSASAAWRLTGDPRSEWLEGDERLVGIYDIEDQLPPLDEVAGILRKLHQFPGQPLAQSVRGGSQTDGNLFERIEPEIVALREALRQAVARHTERLPRFDPAHPLEQDRPKNIRFSGAWSVCLRGGGTHTNHVHPQGWLSSALYIALPPTIEPDEQQGWLKLGEPDAALGLDLPPRRLVEPRPGRLALFPSWMWHGTRPFAAGERLTVAFDVAGAGYGAPHRLSKN